MSLEDSASVSERGAKARERIVTFLVSEEGEQPFCSSVHLSVCLCVSMWERFNVIFLTPHFPDVAPPVERCQGAGPCTKKGSDSLEESRNNPHQSVPRQLKTPTSTTSPNSEQRPLLGNHT